MYFLTGKMGKALDTDGADNSVDVLLATNYVPKTLKNKKTKKKAHRFMSCIILSQQEQNLRG